MTSPTNSPATTMFARVVVVIAIIVGSFLVLAIPNYNMFGTGSALETSAPKQNPGLLLTCGSVECLSRKIEILLDKAPWELSLDELKSIISAKQGEILTAMSELNSFITTSKCQQGCPKRSDGPKFTISLTPEPDATGSCEINSGRQSTYDVCGDCQPSSLFSISGGQSVLRKLHETMASKIAEQQAECPNCSIGLQIYPDEQKGFYWGNSPECPVIGELRPCGSGRVTVKCSPKATSDNWLLSIRIEACIFCEPNLPGGCCLPKAKVACDGRTVEQDGCDCTNGLSRVECQTTACVSRLETGEVASIDSYVGKVDCGTREKQLFLGTYHSGYKCCEDPSITIAEGENPNVTWDHCPSHVFEDYEDPDCDSENSPQCFIDGRITKYLRNIDPNLKNAPTAIVNCEPELPTKSCDVY